ncbi:hypothetical protein PR048_011104 [Dryococelus australis]|uniref:Uncharacterized protein n=1 Tax=Dryococelus australis TaxID=614101 RepID=A0ABQ9HKM4_9NEOP|nr:hypothetical protein PR048_011104 [Dryococelus australis]
MSPNKTLASKLKMSAPSFKKSKYRVTFMAISNADGSSESWDEVKTSTLEKLRRKLLKVSKTQEIVPLENENADDFVQLVQIIPAAEQINKDNVVE